MYFCRYSSPLGNLILAEEEDAIVYCQWEDIINTSLSEIYNITESITTFIIQSLKQNIV